MTALGGGFQFTRFASDSFFRSALESSPDGVQILDLTGALQFVNRNGLALLGARNAADLMGRDWLTLWPEETRAAALAVLRAAAAGTSPQRFTGQLLSGGGTRHIDSVICALCDEGDRPTALLVTSRDVTEMQAARQAAEARERQAEINADVLRTAAEMAKVGGWEIDYGRGVLVHSEEVVRLIGGGPREQPMDQGLLIYDPPDRSRVAEMMARARTTGERVQYEAPFTRHDGSRGWLRSYGEAVYDKGECIGIRGAAMDITEEKAAEASVRRAEERLQLAAELAGLRVYDLDVRARTVTHAGSADPVLDFEPTFDDLYPDASRLVDPRDRARVDTEREHWFETGGAFRAEYRLNRRDGQERWAYSVAEVERDEAGRPTRILAAIVDTTERKAAELEMLRNLAQMREHEARQKLLLDEVNHRVKNTLAAVQSIAVQTLKDAGVPADASEMLLDRLMALSSTHNLLVRHAWEGASLRELVEATVRPYGRPYAVAGPDLRLDPNFAVSLGMALHELATNALKHGAWRGSGRVDLEVAVTDGEAQIVWRESGGPAVVPPAHRGFGSRLLERGVAAELGGQVQMAFVPQGLTCTIRAPLGPRLQAAEAEAGAAAQPSA